MRIFGITALVLAGLLWGCRTDDQTGWDYGRAYHTVFENQKLDPNAGDGSPVLGLDGTVAGAAYTRYRDTKPKEEDKRIVPIFDVRKGQ